MELNADFERPVVVHAGALPWVPSPVQGIEARMLDRIGGEVARATAIVRYAPGSRFPCHVHPGGEELLILEGELEDEHGRYPRGSYVRHPPGSEHASEAGGGCVIFVKRWQMGLDETEVLRVPPQEGELFADGRERVTMLTLSARAPLERANPGGLELLVVDGDLAGEHGDLRAWSWLRLPAPAALSATAGPDGARVWIKEGHVAGARARFDALTTAMATR